MRPPSTTEPLFSHLAPSLLVVEAGATAPVPVPVVFAVVVAPEPVFAVAVPVAATFPPVPVDPAVAVTTAEPEAPTDPVAAPASALKAAGVMTLEYPGNSFNVYAGAPKSVKAFPGRFDKGSSPGSPAGRFNGLVTVPWNGYPYFWTQVSELLFRIAQLSVDFEMRCCVVESSCANPRIERSDFGQTFKMLETGNANSQHPHS